MFIRRPNQTTVLENYINNFFNTYKVDILNLHNKQWDEEDISGKSCIQYDIFKYYEALYFVILIYLEVKQGIHTKWSYYIDKYYLVHIKKCLACHNIDLDKILNIFGLPIIDCIGGIECMGLEIDFEIEPQMFIGGTLPKYNINDLLNNLQGCTYLLPQC